MIGVFLPFLLLANYVCALHDFSALGHATDAIENEARLGKLDLAHEGTPDLHSSLSADKTPSQNHGSQPTLPLFPIVLGSSAFSAFFNDEETLESQIPEQTLLHALRSGINAIDTSPYYANSEIILGKILAKPGFSAEFPRSSYHLLTKCGRYGPGIEDFDYTPDRIRRSVKDSCERLNTDYLDAVYLHDVEFVAEEVGDGTPTERGRSHGTGDLIVIEAAKTLFDLKDKGLIKNVGISGYPLPTLLRLSRLIAKELEKPLDLLMSYSHYTLQNESLKDYIPAFKRAGVRQLINASPLSMGLLRAQGPMPWHPAPPPLREACSKAAKLCSKDYDTTLERVALGFGLGAEVPVVVGLSKVEEVKECLKVRSELWEESDDEKEKQIRLVKRKELDEVVKEVRKLLEASGFMNWSWPSRS